MQRSGGNETSSHDLLLLFSTHQGSAFGATLVPAELRQSPGDALDLSCAMPAAPAVSGTGVHCWNDWLHCSCQLPRMMTWNQKRTKNERKKGEHAHSSAGALGTRVCYWGVGKGKPCANSTRAHSRPERKGGVGGGIETLPAVTVQSAAPDSPAAAAQGIPQSEP